MTQGPRCETCDADRIPGERYCKTCRKVALDQMKRSGYLAPATWRGKLRTRDMQENVRETKHGPDR